MHFCDIRWQKIDIEHNDKSLLFSRCWWMLTQHPWLWRACNLHQYRRVIYLQVRPQFASPWRWKNMHSSSEAELFSFIYSLIAFYREGDQFDNRSFLVCGRRISKQYMAFHQPIWFKITTSANSLCRSSWLCCSPRMCNWRSVKYISNALKARQHDRFCRLPA